MGIVLVMLNQNIVGTLLIAFGLAQAISNTEQRAKQESVPIENVRIIVNRNGPKMPDSITLVTESPSSSLKSNIIQYGLKPVYETIKWLKKKVAL